MKKQIIENLIIALIGGSIALLTMLSVRPICYLILWLAENVF